MLPHICIVLASYRPNARYFKAQVDSIRAQTHTDWTCLIVDDASGEGFEAEMLAAVRDDARFVFSPSKFRRGVYHNFERGLAEVPAKTQFVCLSDQDDLWLPHKLEYLLRAFHEPTVQLVHSDLEVVDAEANSVAPSCWGAEKRNPAIDSPELLLLKNTITGCAAMFRSSLIPSLLPFPPQGRNPAFYQDVWIGMVATAHGKLRTVNEPLVRYRQHGNNLVGATLKKSARIDLWQYMREARTDWLRRMRFAESFHVQTGYRCRYFVEEFDLGFRMALLGLVSLLSHHRPLTYAFRCWVGKVLHDLTSIKLLGGRLNRALRKTGSVALSESEKLYCGDQKANRVLRSESFKDKESSPPLRYEFGASLPKHFNILVPTLHRTHLYGGIATALKLGLELAKQGHPIRFMPTNIPLTARIREDFFQFLTLNFSAYAETFPRIRCVDATNRRDTVLKVGKDDTWVATAWWTALLADAVVQDPMFTQRKFLYLIQDFEPCFYAWSTEFALAEASYRSTRYDAIFNSSFLAAYFKKNAISTATRDWTLQPEIDFGSFFPPTENELRRRKRTRVFVYGRPTVARNLFPVVVASLEQWILRRQLTDKDVEIVSAGEPHATIRFKNGLEMRSLGKMDFSIYPSMLRTFDIGLSLMLSPHPSYPPLEMAASGLLTVTNTYDNKNLTQLSPNFVSCTADPNSVAKALETAWERRLDFARRIENSRYSFLDSQSVAQIVAEYLRN